MSIRIHTLETQLRAFQQQLHQRNTVMRMAIDHANGECHRIHERLDVIHERHGMRDNEDQSLSAIAMTYKMLYHEAKEALDARIEKEINTEAKLKIYKSQRDGFKKERDELKAKINAFKLLVKTDIVASPPRKKRKLMC